MDAASNHGHGGLSDPVHALRCIAERADVLGLSEGLLTARSNKGDGRHAWLILPEPASLADAVNGVAALSLAALKIADSDAEDGEEVAHAFRCDNGTIAQMGQSGAVELLPRSTLRPQLGWAMTLPAAGALAVKGGGIIIDPFTNAPLAHDRVPQCSMKAWATLTQSTQAELARRHRPTSNPEWKASRRRFSRGALTRIHPATRELLEGRTAPRERNRATFAAICNMLGHGIDPTEAERSTLAGALACGLTEREARNAIRSALKAKGIC